jgi:hypothetical protein
MTLKVGLAIALASFVLVSSPLLAEDKKTVRNNHEALVNKLNASSDKVIKDLGTGRVTKPPKGQHSSQRSGRK